MCPICSGPVVPKSWSIPRRQATSVFRTSPRFRAAATSSRGPNSSGLGTDTSGSGVRAQLFDALGNKVGVEFQVNSTLPGSQINPCVITLPSGRFVITWTDSSGLGGDPSSSAVKAQVFEANGTALGGEFLVNSVTAGSQALPQITELGNGGFVVTWADGSNFSSSRSHDIRAQLFDGAGIRIGTEFLVNTTTLGSQFQPGVVALSSGGFAIAWHNTELSAPYDHSVRFQIYGPTGAPVGSEQVVMSNLGDISTPIVMAQAGTGFVAIWGVGDSAVGLEIKGQLFSASGAKIGAAFPVNSTTAGDQVAADVDALPGGGFLVTWQGPSGVGVDTNVYGQVFNSGGSKVGTEFVLSSVTAGNQTRARVDVLTSGDVVVTWSDTSGVGGDFDSSAVKAQILTPASDPPSDINLSASAVSETAFGNSVVASLSATGAINTSFDYEIVSDSTGGAFRIDGDRLVVDDNRRLDFETQPSAELRIRVTDLNGHSHEETFHLDVTDVVNEVRYAAGNEFLAHDNTSGFNGPVSVTPLASGDILIVTAYFESGVGSGFRGQIFDASGEALAPEFEINLGIGGGGSPDVTSLPSGGFLVVHQGPGSPIHAQLFDSSGAPTGSDILVSTTDGILTVDPSVTVLESGNFVVTWSLHQHEDASDVSPLPSQIVAQMFDEFRCPDWRRIPGQQCDLGRADLLRRGGAVGRWLRCGLARFRSPGNQGPVFRRHRRESRRRVHRGFGHPGPSRERARGARIR